MRRDAICKCQIGILIRHINEQDLDLAYLS
jgi:hypothetical protein